MKAYDPGAKRGALVLWIALSVLWVGVMALPLYLLRHTLAARTDYRILLLLLFLWATWTWLKLALLVGKRIKNLPVEPSF
jgi:hypothetical protein